MRFSHTAHYFCGEYTQTGLILFPPKMTPK